MTDIPIAPEDRGWATMTHLSGLAGYIVPLAGVIVQIIIWIAKSDHPVISAIARQAVLLNVAVFCALVVSFILWITIILIPLMWALAVVLGLIALVVPIVGAVKASSGVYYRYPVVGSNP